MNKVLIELEVPAVSAKYEIFIPTDLLAEELRRLLAASVEEITNGQYVSSGSELLCLKERNQILREKEYVYHYKIANGEYLILM